MTSRTHDEVSSPDRPLEYPAAPDDLDRAFLSAALSAGAKGPLVVEDFDVLECLRGTATKLRLALRYEAGSVGPEFLWVKAGWEAHSPRVAAQYRAEVDFYSRLAPTMDINVPGCYFAGVDPRSGMGLLLLEDLGERGVTFGDPTTPLTPGQVAAVLELQARYHARYWDNPVARRLSGSHAESGIIESMLAEPHWSTQLANPRGAFLSAALRDRERLGGAVLRLAAITNHPEHPCLIHADPHLGNLFFEADGRPGILDWQSPQCGNWAHDYAYTVIGSLTVEDRRAAEADLLRGYLAQLAANGVAAPDFDTAWIAYRKHALYGVMWALCPPQMQREENVVAMTQRFAAGATDLGSLDLL